MSSERATSIPPYWFFFSHATTDTTGGPWVKKFYEELAQHVRMFAPLKADVPVDHIGFSAGESIYIGNDWPHALAEGLQKSKVLVCLLSPSYVCSLYCGREFHIFQARWKAHAAKQSENVPRPPVILPVQWIPVDDADLPPILRDIQSKHDSFGPRYAKMGLYLMRKLYRKDYDKFLWEFARRLVDAAKKYPMDQLDALPPVKEAPSEFHPSATAPSILPLLSTTASSTKIVQFLFVAGRPSDFKKAQVKQNVAGYSTDGGRSWRPYFPQVGDDIGYMAQAIATQERFQFDVLPLKKNLVPLVRKAEKNGKIVVIIVDNWTLLLEKYCIILRKYHESDAFDTVALVLLNPSDPEVATSLTALQNSFSAAFPRRASAQGANDVRYPVNSKDELFAELSAVLQKAKLRILRMFEEFRQPATGQIITKPEIRGPGGGRS